MIKRMKKKPVAANWLITYSDMMTLLLCFFVLMFSMSSMDNSKWQILVKNLNPNASLESNVVNEMSLGEQTELPAVKSFEQLSKTITEYVDKNDLQEDVEVHAGDGYTFLVFRNNIFFDGDRYDLKPGGREILDYLASGILGIQSDIQEVRILGHTNQADPNRPNEARGDRFLASNRATEVLTYLQLKNVVEPKKLISEGYGQHFPIASFSNEADRVMNRRVEILITETGAIVPTLEEIYENIDREENAIGVEDIQQQ